MAKGKKRTDTPGVLAGIRRKLRPLLPVAAATPQKGTQEKGKVLEYGPGDTLPQDILKVIQDSPTAMLCWDKKARFIKADGFANRATGKLRVNPLQTLDDLLPEVAFDAAAFGFALRVKYNDQLQVAEVYHLPFHQVRKLDNGGFLFNKTLGTPEHKKDQDEYLPAFDPTPAVVQELITQAATLDAAKPDPNNQPGQVLYVYLKNSLQPLYPVPACWTGKTDMQAERFLLNADLKSISKRLQVNTLWYVPGVMDPHAADNEGKSELDKAFESIEMLYDEDALFGLRTGATKEDIPQADFLDSMSSLLSADQKRESIGRAICRWWGIPPELGGWATAGQLGNNEQMRTIIGMLQQDVLDIQSLIQRTVELLFPAFDATLTNYNILGDIPDRIWNVMQENEKRNLAGLPELDTEQTGEGQKVLNALNSLSPLVATKVLESMTINQILSLVGLPPVEGGDSNKNSNGPDTQ
jgi:hypothetical protein